MEQTFVTWLDEPLPQSLAAGREQIKAVSTKGSSPSVESAANAINQADETPSPPNLFNIDSSLQAGTVLRSHTPSGNQQLMFKADVDRKLCHSTSEFNSSQLT
jgi:hypothetical protein